VARLSATGPFGQAVGKLRSILRNPQSKIWAMLLVATVACAFYSPSLRFGFFNDDPTGHFRWMEGRSIISLLTDASGHGYYRPVSFILWQILYTVLGRHDPFVLHLLNVLAHAGSAALVTWLAYQLTGRLPYAALSGMLFALYPFSYEAVPYVGSFVHPLGTSLILLTLAFYCRWRREGARWIFVAAHVTLTLATFTQENAVITPVLMLLLGVLVFSDRSKAQRTSRLGPSLSFFAQPIIFAAVWLWVPKTVETRVLDISSMRANVLPFVQALVYPVAPLAHYRPTTLAIAALAALMVLLALAYRSGAIRLFIFGVLVWALAALPSIMILNNAYVLGSPRLFYLGSVGAAMIWALPALASKRSESGHPAAEWGIGLVVLALCYLPTAAYVRCELAYQGMAGEIGRMMAGAARSAAPGQDVTFVNLPYFFSSRGAGTECSSPFVFAPTGAVVIPPYADPRDFVRYNGGPDIAASGVSASAYQPGWSTFGAPISVQELRSRLLRSRVFVFDLVGWRLWDLSATWQPGTAIGQPRATFDGVQILAFESRAAGATEVVTLTWQTVAPIQDRKVFVHVYDSGGKLVSQDDSLPARGLAPALWWQAGDVVTDTHVVTLGSLPPGEYRVSVGMYGAADGARTAAHGPDDRRLRDDELTVAQITR
jgi:hypothetical protein